jgi:hypothetical protein
MLSNGHSASSGNGGASADLAGGRTVAATTREPWIWRLLGPSQDRGDI